METDTLTGLLIDQPGAVGDVEDLKSLESLQLLQSLIRDPRAACYVDVLEVPAAPTEQP